MAAKRVVLKFGTGILTKTNGSGLDTGQFRKLVQEVARLCASGHRCVLVSSGSIGAGMMALGLQDRPSDLASLQACAAVGQSRLMRLYDSLFCKHGLTVAQVLLTHQDIDSRIRYVNARNTIDRLLERGDVVPIINENDTVAVEELRFGDNDRLSAEVAILARAELLILLTGVDGLLEKSKQDSSKRRLIPVVRDMRKAAAAVDPEIGRLSVGGMATKLLAAQTAVEAGIPVVISNGRKPELIPGIVAGKKIGTRFPVPKPGTR